MDLQTILTVYDKVRSKCTMKNIHTCNISQKTIDI